MKTTTNNITALQEEELDNVNGGIVSATVAVCVLGAAMFGTTLGVLGKCVYNRVTGKQDYKKAQKENPEAPAA